MAAASLVLGLNKNSDATPLATPTLTARPVTAATLAPPPTALPLADATLAAVARIPAPYLGYGPMARPVDQLCAYGPSR